MRAIRVDDSDPSRVLLDEAAAQPKPGAGEVLIRVAAAGVTLAELSWYPTSHQKSGEPRVGAIPGHEFSGLVAAVGKDVGRLAVGHAVFGMNDWYADGAMAEYCTAPYFAIAPKPSRLTLTQAASVPISALAAWQALFDHAKLHRGETVLIHGGAGAVGSFAIQFAHLFGAHVTTTAAARDHDFVRHLGASQVIDYQGSKFDELVKEMDVVVDTVGGETLARSWTVLKPEGRIVTLASSEANSPDPRIKQAFFTVEPNQKQLVEIAHLFDASKLHTTVDSVVPLTEVPDLYTGKVRKPGRGKLVASIDQVYV
ncbi:MAG TPA: NADP-dependent oxidoreductase [Bryobacteraceae bacterium]|jgi:NADPH:quinone reductase-like Zn-dependent oxidoreductase